MERKVQWSRPENIGNGHRLIYRSKCGRYQITRKHYAGSSSRNGHFTQVVYQLEFLQKPTQKASQHDSLRDAKDWAEMDLDESWEPS